MSEVYPARLLRDEAIGGGVYRLRWQVDGMPSFEAGQYTALIGEDERPVFFTIVSPPSELPELELHYAPTPDSPDVAVMDALRRNRHARLAPALGQVTLSAQPTCQRWLVIVAATGVSQALALSAAADGSDRELVVYWGVRHAEALYVVAHATLERRACERASFRYVPVVSEDSTWAGRTGLVVDAAIADAAHLWAERIVLAGSPVMVQASAQRLRQAGVGAERLLSDLL